MLELSTILSFASRVGFDACGAARVRRLDEDTTLFEQWLLSGHHGSMQYMQTDTDKRLDPRLLVDGCKTVIVGLMSYHKQEKQVSGAPFISQSGLSQQDYHLVVKSHLQQLEQLIVEHYGSSVVSSSHQHLHCDSSPVLERRWAQLAGLGYIGKNHQLINPTLGSFVHIGILFLQDELDEYSEPFTRNLCQDCDKCLKACPTAALRTNPFDARKCVAYLTIERKETLPAQYTHLLEDRLYGCDTCQDVCPHNTNAAYTTHSQLKPHPTMLKMTARDWQQTSRRQKIKLLHRLAK